MHHVRGRRAVHDGGRSERELVRRSPHLGRRPGVVHGVRLLVSDGCMLCAAEPLTDRYFEDAECWVGDCVVCMTPMVVWRTHGLPLRTSRPRCSRIWSASPPIGTAPTA